MDKFLNSVKDHSMYEIVLDSVKFLMETFWTQLILKVSKYQKHFTWNSIAHKKNEMFDIILP